MNIRKKNKEQPEKITQAIFVIDESGSMSICQDSTITGINEQIQELKKHPEISTNVTFITFSGTVTDRLVNEPVEKLEEIDKSSYYPSGSTALFDAVAHAILQEEERTYNTDDVTRLLIIVTDGDENSSNEYSRYNNGSAKIAEMIKRVQEKGWTVSYLGANQDLTQVQKDFGLHASNIANFTSTAEGTAAAFSTTTKSLGRYMANRVVSDSSDSSLTTNFYSENEEISDIDS